MIFCYSHRPVPQPNHHQRGFIQQLMGTDAETYSQTLGGAQGIMSKREEGQEGLRTPEGHGSQKQLSRVHRGSQKLKWQPWSLHSSVLGSLQKCWGCSACGFCGSASDFFCLFLPSQTLIQEFVPSLAITCYGMFS